MPSTKHCLVLAIFGAVAVTGCGSTSNAPESNEEGSPQPKAATSPTGGLRISAPALQHANLNHLAPMMFVAQGGNPAYRLALIDGALPAGLKLEASGQLSGTPTESGRFTFTLQVTDAAGGSAQAAYQLNVAEHRLLQIVAIPATERFGTPSR